MNHPSVSLTNLRRLYGDREALRGVTLDVEAGSIFGLLGPNGSGKTTLFRILATLLTPTDGTALIGGFDVVRERAAVRRKIGVVFQQPSLDHKLTVRENLMHQGHLYGLRGPALRERGDRLLARFGVADRARDRVETLSGGLMRRIELAKGLLHRPEVLILDEPSTGLDPGARRELMDYLQELRQADGMTVLLTTHLLDEADRCDRLAILEDGKVVGIDTPARLKSAIGGDVIRVHARRPTEFATKVTDRFGCAAEILDGIVQIECADGVGFVAKLAAAFPREFDSLSVGKPTLEDVFLRLTGHRFAVEGGGAADPAGERA